MCFALNSCGHKSGPDCSNREKKTFASAFFRFNWRSKWRQLVDHADYYVSECVMCGEGRLLPTACRQRTGKMILLVNDVKTNRIFIGPINVAIEPLSSAFLRTTNISPKVPRSSWGRRKSHLAWEATVDYLCSFWLERNHNLYGQMTDACVKMKYNFLFRFPPSSNEKAHGNRPTENK